MCLERVAAVRAILHKGCAESRRKTGNVLNRSVAPGTSLFQHRCLASRGTQSRVKPRNSLRCSSPSLMFTRAGHVERARRNMSPLRRVWHVSTQFRLGHCRPWLPNTTACQQMLHAFHGPRCSRRSSVAQEPSGRGLHNR
ncbi:unnamed protein product [Effrenium voratum]|nr:unnamed protein product [Effrenium voratum]CAJ1413762.1 unnamed protein product [Effrenium voratum]